MVHLSAKSFFLVLEKKDYIKTIISLLAMTKVIFSKFFRVSPKIRLVKKLNIAVGFSQRRKNGHLKS